MGTSSVQVLCPGSSKTPSLASYKPSVKAAQLLETSNISRLDVTWMLLARFFDKLQITQYYASLQELSMLSFKIVLCEPTEEKSIRLAVIVTSYIPSAKFSGIPCAEI